MNRMDRPDQTKVVSPPLRGRPSGLNVVGETMLDGEARQLDAVRDAELFEHVGEMVLDGMRTDGELLGDVLVGRAHDDRGNDVELTRRQVERRLRLGGAARAL